MPRQSGRGTGSLATEAIPVVFVTTVFEGADTGPGTYARYLWREFRDDPEINFHIVAPASHEVHPNLHLAGQCGGSLGLYRRVQELAEKVAQSLGPTTIVHGNSAHGMGRFVGYQGSLILQINDYDVATLRGRVLETIRARGGRRLAALAWRRYQEQRVVGRASLLVCNSEFTADAVRTAYAVPSDKIRVVHKAVDTTHFRRPDSLPGDPRPARHTGTRLIFIGADWHRKGLDTLLEAMALMARKVPGLSLAVIGPDRDDVALESLIASLGLQENVDVLGRIPTDLVALHLWHSDIFVLPSRREALGVAVLEAMAAGVPVVAASVGGIPEILRPETEGLLVPPDQPLALAESLVRLLGHADLRSRFVAAGWERSQEFQVRAMALAIKAIYRSLAPPGGELAA
jgi:glycosyltransferase involved in cell wall biosynthesis